ncbi:MAG TPA: sigma-54-dependent Fis family transcriptional regulator [Bacteroidetes bacterium]|nr:sigma-54-dependent Fis family transcriptional regulator [Bacteroidota bacterium]
MANRGKGRSVLVVDDSEMTLELLRRNLESAGFTTYTALSVPGALQLLETTPVDLVVTDVKMPGVSGLDLVRHIQENLRDTEVMVITGYPNVNGAVTAMKNGALDYLTKPFTDEELLSSVNRAFDKLEMRRADSSRKRTTGAHRGLLGDSRAMESIYTQIERASRTRAIVLISGESGTGKELVARAIHYASERKSAPFVPVNCGAIPQGLLESELFGHVKGAFTGATESRAGFFLTADGGTLFLDEIGETSQAMQVKLLRVLQEKEVCMVGSSRPRKIDVRIIVATNKDLAELVRKGTFREDLYFRINVLPIYLPPLRNRESDIILLTNHFAAKYAEELNRPVPQFTDRVLDIFRNYAWPGNVRELENVVQRLVVMTDGDHIDAPDLPSLMRFSAAGAGTDLRRTLAEVEADYVRNVLESVGGNKTRAAQILGIDRKTLRVKLKELPADTTERDTSGD